MSAGRSLPLAIPLLTAFLAGNLVRAGEAPRRPEEAGPVGWASVGEGTTGGADGRNVKVSDAETLVKVAATAEARGIYIVGTIRLKDDVRVGSNTSILGVGADAGLAGGGLHLHKVHNVIVRNLAISDATDAIGIEGSHHVWVDHCDLAKCRDGLLDIKRGSDFVTVSWNRFHDHRKTCLLGHSDKPDIRRIDAGHLRVTYHHNFFDGSQTRHPRVRFGNPVHVFNNYFRGNHYGVASVMDAGVIVEGNYFQDVRQPTLTRYGDSPDPGRLVERANRFVRSGPPQTAGKVDEKGLAYTYRLDGADRIPETVRAGAGVGRLVGMQAPPSE